MKRSFLVSLLSAGLLAVVASPALAAKTAASRTTSAAGCVAPALSSALASFGDWRSYFLAPGGDFESGAHGWTLTGGATTSTGSSPLRLGAATKSLRLPAGATATSPAFCVDLNYPTFRFFAAQGKAPLSVDVIYPALGTNKPKATTVKGGATGWTLAKDVDLRPTIVTKNAGWRLVQLRYVADKALKGDWLVDDVLIDPKMR
jgi:hypothetical protein